MGKRKNEKRNFSVACITLLGILMLSSSGCDKYTKYKVTTFFFTGVPPIQGEDILPEKKAEKSITSAQIKKQGLQREIKSFTHGPFAAGQCYHCHNISASVGFSKFGKDESGKILSSDKTMPGRLVAPPRELCKDCHSDKTAQTAYSRGLWIHGPVSNGICNECHSPHQSPFQYMLIKEKSKELCAPCHAEGYILVSEAHSKNEECISCHNPHVGKNRSLLKKDFNEVF